MSALSYQKSVLRELKSWDRDYSEIGEAFHAVYRRHETIPGIMGLHIEELKAKMRYNNIL